jgi:hypothetical protein
MQAFGQALTNIEIQAQDRENADMLFRAETALKGEYLTFEDDVRNNRKGQAAWGVTKDADKWFAEQQKKHGEILTNDAQRKLFGQSIAKLRQSALNSLSGYEAGERRRSLEESAAASIVGSINLAAANAADWVAKPAARVPGPDGQPVERLSPMVGIKADITKRVQTLAAVNGWTPERKGAEEARHLTNLHRQVIQNLADSHPDEARAYFNANKAEINGTEHDGIEKVLGIAGAKQAGFQFAEREDIRALNEADALTAARDNFKDDPAKREAAIQEIKTRFGEAKRAGEQVQRDASDEAWSIYARTEDFGAVPARVLSAMDGRDLESLRTHAANKAAGVGVKTDFAVWSDLNTRIANGERVDLRPFVTSIATTDLKQLEDRMNDSEKLKDAATLQQQLTNTHGMLKWGASDKDKRGAFDKAVTDAIDNEQQRVGKRLSYDERQAIIDRLVIEGDVNGPWYLGGFGGKRRFYEVQGTADVENFEPAIDANDRLTIIEKFKARAGRLPTDVEITQTFRKWKGL